LLCSLSVVRGLMPSVSASARVHKMLIAWHRLSLIWIGLLGAIQSADIITTSIGRARGAIEAMPISAAVMNEGGMTLFVVVKFALVVAGAAAVFITLRWVRADRPGAAALYSFTLAAIRGSTVALALVTLHNAFLLKSL
jgi:hypothetical protein